MRPAAAPAVLADAVVVAHGAAVAAAAAYAVAVAAAFVVAAAAEHAAAAAVPFAEAPLEAAPVCSDAVKLAQLYAVPTVHVASSVASEAA